MKTIEVRRHSIRSKSGQHLNQSGVALARLVGQNLGPFDRVVTSTHPRAFETAIAMGFAVDEQIELMSTYSDNVEHEVPWPQSFAAYAKAVKRGGEAAAVCQSTWRTTTPVWQITWRMDVLRWSLTMAELLNWGWWHPSRMPIYQSWGDAVDYCEGARLYWENGKLIVKRKLLRVSR